MGDNYFFAVSVVVCEGLYMHAYIQSFNGEQNVCVNVSLQNYFL